MAETENAKVYFTNLRTYGRESQLDKLKRLIARTARDEHEAINERRTYELAQIAHRFEVVPPGSKRPPGDRKHRGPGICNRPIEIEEHSRTLERATLIYRFHTPPFTLRATPTIIPEEDK